MSTLALYKRLLPFITPYWKRFMLACLATIPLASTSAGIAYLVKPALDEVLIKQDREMLLLIPLAVIGLHLVKGLFEYTYHYLMGSAGHKIITDLRNRLYNHFQTLSLSFFQKHPTGKLMTRITNDVTMLQHAINEGIIKIFKESITIIGLVGVLFNQDLELALISFLVLPWALLPIWRFGKKSRKFSTRWQETVGNLSTFMHETISGCRIVKAFGMEEYENKRFAAENRRLWKIRLTRLRIRATVGPLMEFIGGLAGAAVIFYGGYNVLKGNATPGEFFSFLAALLMLYGPTRTISAAYQDIQEGLAAAVRVFEMLDTTPDISEQPDAQALPPVKGHIAFSNVQFSYDESPVLRDINLTVTAGESVAIVGMTGSGKTTLVNLIPRFYDANAGTISIDDQDILSVTLGSLRSQIALVSQNPSLFNDTLRNNIAYGDPTKNDLQIIAAAKTASAHAFIEKLPDGYNTVIGEQGVKISGGQRQRLAIARAVLKDAPILIFDEATSALDSRLEKEVQQALQQLMQNRTTFIISHRLSTIQNADRIIVIAGGRIVESGTHDELFVLGGEYTKLYSIYLQDTRKLQSAMS
ncbi:MAG: ATP-binding cassette domain-containing protein [Deltaproteobacteria bacterium]|nr:ATP-binding cassette domain-containing protein [Deltaproteobacteria bacterium]